MTKEATSYVSAPLRETVSTNVDIESPLTRDYGRADESRAEWQRLIDYELIEWGRGPGQPDEDGIRPPSREAVRQAVLIAKSLKKDGVVSPTRLVPDAHGGIVFERRGSGLLESIRISADGRTEYCAFHDARLTKRFTIANGT